MQAAINPNPATGPCIDKLAASVNAFTDQMAVFAHAMGGGRHLPAPLPAPTPLPADNVFTAAFARELLLKLQEAPIQADKERH